MADPLPVNLSIDQFWRELVEFHSCNLEENVDISQSPIKTSYDDLVTAYAICMEQGIPMELTNGDLLRMDTTFLSVSIMKRISL